MWGDAWWDGMEDVVLFLAQLPKEQETTGRKLGMPADRTGQASAFLRFMIYRARRSTP